MTTPFVDIKDKCPLKSPNWISFKLYSICFTSRPKNNLQQHTYLANPIEQMVNTYNLMPKNICKFKNIFIFTIPTFQYLIPNTYRHEKAAFYNLINGGIIF